MKVIIDIGHPGHVHLFRNFAQIFISKGHSVLFTIRKKEYEAELLQAAGLPFIVLGKHYTTMSGKAWGLVRYNLRLLFISLRFGADLFLSHGSLYTLLSAVVLRKPNIALEDSGNPEQVKLYLPFTIAVLTSTSFLFNYGEKQVFYQGYHELAYLHPRYFQPDPEVLYELGLKDGDIYTLVRFVAWTASHDKNHTGLSLSQKIDIVKELNRHGKVFISSESELPAEIEKYKFPIRPDRMHHAIYFASLYIGEGATMASESAILGTHALYINTIKRGYLEEQEKDFALVTHCVEFDSLKERIESMLENPYQTKLETKKLSERLINSKCDVTAFLVKFIEDWPESFEKYKAIKGNYQSAGK